MASTKNVPPGARPWAAATAREGAQHLERNRQWFNTPEMLGAPTNFFGPTGPMDASGLARDFRYMRLLTVIDLRHPEALEHAAALMADTIWADPAARDAGGGVVISEAVLRGVCVRAGLTDAEARGLVAEIDADATKQRLKETVRDCVEAGGYGVPFFRLTRHGQADQPEEIIAFGSDRFEQLAFAIK